MPKVTTKKRDAQQEEFISDSLMAMFAPPGQQKDEPEEEEAPEVDVKGLTDRLAALEKDASTLRQTNMALMQQAPQTRQAPTVEEVSFEGMPDPIDQPKAYAAELNKRIAAQVDQRVSVGLQRAGSASADSNRAQELFNDFAGRDEYAAIAEDEKKLSFAAASVVERMKARGVDIEKYMYQGRDMFFKDVAQEYEQTFGKTKPEADTEEDADTGRAASIFGGQATTRKNKQSQEDKGSDMLADLAEIQLKDGFF